MSSSSDPPVRPHVDVMSVLPPAGVTPSHFPVNAIPVLPPVVSVTPSSFRQLRKIRNWPSRKTSLSRKVNQHRPPATSTTFFIPLFPTSSKELQIHVIKLGNQIDRIAVSVLLQKKKINLKIWGIVKVCLWQTRDNPTRKIAHWRENILNFFFNSNS